MFLRSLSLLGFKTFARPTEIRFEGGVTAIVGPNGSGKTNIVDAIKWVLGSGQARDLRGKKMEEVIYVGGERRSRASYAEVTVVFDNTAGRLPVDYHEVAIKRRVERDGESDYFLNGTRVRRRDLIHILSSTGLTVDSYAIIDQHDIEQIVVCSPAERRALLEEAAQVRGVKTRRQEATQRLTELAQNLLRLEDLRSEIEPRLEVVRVQAASAREAAEALARLELLRGSIVWEEWREARDAHRRASSQAQSLERRLIEAREQAQSAEAEFAAWRSEMQTAQDRRLNRQNRLGRIRLELAAAGHSLELAEERAESHRALAEALRRDDLDNHGQAEAAKALREQLMAEMASAVKALGAVPEPTHPDAAIDPAEAQHSLRAAEQARRAVAVATSSLAGLRTRREFVEQQFAHSQAASEAARLIPDTESVLQSAKSAAQTAESAALSMARLRSELEGLESLRPASAPGLTRLGDVLTAEPGYERALSAVLGPLADAMVAPDEGLAASAGETEGSQRTVLYPLASAPEAKTGSMFYHVRIRPGFELVGRRLLCQVVVGVDVTIAGVYREPGLLRAGTDPRVEIDARRARLGEQIETLAPQAAGVEAAAKRVTEAETALDDLRRRAAGATSLDESRRLLDAAREAERVEAAKLPELERVAADAEELAAARARQLEAVAAQRAALQQAELERARWHDRRDDLNRQIAAVDEDLARQRLAAEERARRVADADSSAAIAAEVLPRLKSEAEAAVVRLADAERESPGEEAEMAEGARRLVALEEARIDARLKAGTLEGNLELIAREAELLAARMEEIRQRMPDGVAPEEIPGGKAREKEMRALERRLQEIGPTNALAEAECRELEERFETLHTQLDDIAGARADLEQLIAKLRDEEEMRYEAVFGAVAANFHEYFSQLAPGGRATLRHADGDEGPRSGVEILVQPARKRLQNVTLLSSGERSLAALALVLALDEVNPSPFTILDEVDAALDDANVGRFGEMVARLGSQRQFLVITHNHVTMSHASTLYGIHLDESGASHIVSVRLEDIRKPATRSATTTAQAG
ncbi:MAG TPA: AAA family ATPase [Candidatus Dormibacteraeota bacterium]|nr:AAA family ATPase [Candidatus Dormibacteraeota bacterium]